MSWNDAEVRHPNLRSCTFSSGQIIFPRKGFRQQDGRCRLSARTLGVLGCWCSAWWAAWPLCAVLGQRRSLQSPLPFCPITAKVSLLTTCLVPGAGSRPFVWTVLGVDLCCPRWLRAEHPAFQGPPRTFLPVGWALRDRRTVTPSAGAPSWQALSKRRSRRPRTQHDPTAGLSASARPVSLCSSDATLQQQGSLWRRLSLEREGLAQGRPSLIREPRPVCQAASFLSSSHPSECGCQIKISCGARKYNSRMDL